VVAAAAPVSQQQMVAAAVPVARQELEAAWWRDRLPCRSRLRC
jgi:hypothetical protein